MTVTIHSTTAPGLASAASTSASGLRPIANMCTSGSCPTIYQDSPSTVVIQGFAVSSTTAGIDLPDGELLVQVPTALLKEALTNIA